jgi:hypothetical protein
MPLESAYLLIASMDVDPAHEARFNEVYDEHARHLLRVPGVLSVTRMKGEPFVLAIAGGEQPMPAPSPVYTAIYELDDPAVLAGAAWAAAVERGRWASEIRPHTRNRHHAVYAVRPTMMAAP